MKIWSSAKTFVLTSVLLACSVPALADPDFSTIPYVAYGDGESYSLPISQALDGCTGPGCDFYIASTPGAIKDLIVVATGSNGKPVTTNIAGIDDAYATPNGKKGANFYETSDTANDPGASNGDPTTQLDWAWDAEIDSLNSFRLGKELVFFFNNNQINSCDSACQSLAFWAQLWVTDKDGILVGNVFEFVNQIPPIFNGTSNNIPGTYSIVSTGTSGGIPSAIGGDPTLFTSDIANPLGAEPLAGSNAATDYVLSGGQICLNASAVPVLCDGSQAAGPFNHNLGANEAAYAVVFPELNALIDGLAANAGYTLHIDFNMGCDPSLGPNAGAVGDNVNDLICTGADGGDLGRNLNNGFEQIFIATASTVSNVPIPSPGTILLLGLGLLGLGLIRRKPLHNDSLTIPQSNGAR